MMRVGVVTLFPPMFEAVTRYGVTGRAVQQGLVDVMFWNPRDYAGDSHRTVDDRPYGGGPGMVMMVGPLRAAIREARSAIGAGACVAYLSPQGRRLDHAAVEMLAARERLILVAGRYEGVDERVIERDVDEEWSLGDFVLSGGEIAAMALIDAMVRTVPGALGHEDSAREDSFADGLLDYPHYTRPEVIDGQGVPSVLLSGDHAAIRRWRRKQALGRTWLRRPEMLAALRLDAEQQALLEEFIREFRDDKQ